MIVFKFFFGTKTISKRHVQDAALILFKVVFVVALTADISTHFVMGRVVHVDTEFSH